MAGSSGASSDGGYLVVEDILISPVSMMSVLKLVFKVYSILNTNVNHINHIAGLQVIVLADSIFIDIGKRNFEKILVDLPSVMKS